MTTDEMLNIPGSNNPVLLKDGRFGMLVIYPTEETKAGIQVHGEDDLRWIAPEDLTCHGNGALKEKGEDVVMNPEGLVQYMLSVDWESRYMGG